MEAEFLGILGGGNAVECWMSSPSQTTDLHIQVIHLGIIEGELPQFILMPNSYSGFHKAVPVLLGP